MKTNTIFLLTVCLGLAVSLHIEVYINDTTVYTYDDEYALFEYRSSIRIGDSVEGYLMYPVPRNACSNVDMPPNNTFIALVPDYDDCPYQNIENVYEKYSMLLSYSPTFQLLPDVPDFPVVIIRNDKDDFLKFLENLLSTETFAKIKVVENYFSLYEKIIIMFCLVLMSAITLALLIFFCTFCTKWVYAKWKRRGLTRWRIRQLPQRRYRLNNETTQTCSICLEDFQDGEKIRVLPCQHIYHPKCVDEWLQKWNRTCPLCKCSISRKERTVRVDEESTDLLGDPANSTADDDNEVHNYGATADRELLITPVVSQSD